VKDMTWHKGTYLGKSMVIFPAQLVDNVGTHDSSWNSASCHIHLCKVYLHRVDLSNTQPAETCSCDVFLISDFNNELNRALGGFHKA
jgi:hypothetical protein